MLKENNLNQKYKKAFSLLELSLVILIVGILIASITQGSKLLNSSKLANAQALTASSPVTTIDGLTLWLETSASGSIQTTANGFKPENNDEVNLWKDRNNQSINKLDVSQSTSGSYPRYIKYGISDLPALQFDGSNDWLEKTNVSIKSLSKRDQITIFMVQRYIAGNNTLIWWQNGTTAMRLNIHAPEGGFIRFDFGAGAGNRISVAAPATYANNPTLLTFIRNPTTGTIRFNGVNILANSTFTATLDEGTLQTLGIGRVIGAPGYFFNGMIGEIIIFNRNLTIAEYTEIEKYLGKKWNIKFN